MTRLLASHHRILCPLGGASSAAAQDLVITNARIIVGTGTTIERGSIVVRNGRIVSSPAGAPAAPAARARSTRRA